jgi:hypothetical protein
LAAVVRAVIKSFEGLDRDEPGSYVSPDPLDDSFWLRMLVGPPDRPGGESFDVLVCTPAWLRRVVSKEGPQVELGGCDATEATESVSAAPAERRLGCCTWIWRPCCSARSASAMASDRSTCGCSMA